MTHEQECIIEELENICINNEYVLWLLAKLKDYERPQDRWIPVSERLPEKNGNYLCTVDYGEDGIEVMQRVYWDALGGFEKRYNKNDKVIAWMPLPEAYKEEKNEV